MDITSTISGFQDALLMLHHLCTSNTVWKINLNTTIYVRNVFTNTANNKFKQRTVKIENNLRKQTKANRNNYEHNFFLVRSSFNGTKVTLGFSPCSALQMKSAVC